MLQSPLLVSILMASLFLTSEAGAQNVRYAEPIVPTPVISPMTQSSAPSSRQAGDLPDLVLVENEWCPDIEDFCPISEYDFGTVATGASGPYLVLFVRNESGAVPATNLSIQTDAEFPVFPDPHDCSSVESLPPGEICRVRVKFAPTALGPVTGMLTVTSAEGAEASLPLQGTGGDDRLLYGQFHDWETMPHFWSIRNAIDAASPIYSAELADDFVVDDPKGWVINQVGLEVMMFVFMPGGGVDSFDVFIMEDDDGIPGDVAVCSAPDSKVHFWDMYDESRVELTLSTPCALPPGHYWLRVHLHINEAFSTFHYGWGFQFLTGTEEEPPGEAPVHLNPLVWRNPGNNGGHGCTEWTPIYPPACGLDFWWPVSVAYGAIFWLIGEPDTVSNEGTPNETVHGLTHPSPNPVRETASFTLTVDRGQQVVVEVFDIMGRRVQALYEGSLPAGATQTLRFDANALSSGVYVIRALGEDFVDTRRITVVR